MTEQADRSQSLNSLLGSLHRERRTRATTTTRYFQFGDLRVSVLESATESMGSRVHDGSLSLAEYFAAMPATTFGAKSSVLELGSGTALAGIAFRRHFPNAGHVYLSDREEQRKLIEQNLKLNSLDCERDNISFSCLEWGTPSAASASLSAAGIDAPFPVVIASDVVPSDVAKVDPLIQSLCELTCGGGQVFFAQSSIFEDKSQVPVALLRRQAAYDRKPTPLQVFLSHIDVAFDIRNVVRNRVWIFTRRTGCWFTIPKLSNSSEEIVNNVIAETASATEQDEVVAADDNDDEKKEKSNAVDTNHMPIGLNV